MVSQLSEIWSGFSIPVPDPDFLPIPDPDPVSQIPNPGVKKALEPWSRILDPDSQHWKFWLSSGCRGYRWLLTFNGRCCLNNSFNGSALRSFYVQKRILRICYFNIISLILPFLSYGALRICFLTHLVCTVFHWRPSCHPPFLEKLHVYGCFSSTIFCILLSAKRSPMAERVNSDSFSTKYIKNMCCYTCSS